jgi:hypothetical protein
MSTWRIIALLMLTVNGIAQPNFKKAVTYAKTITAQDLKKHLSILAGPAMEGRETGTPGQQKAAAYIEEQMKAIGLAPAYKGAYQVPYPVYHDSVTKAVFTINGKQLSWKHDFAASPTNFPSKLRFSELVWVDVNDTIWKENKLDVNGKLVLVYGKSARDRSLYQNPFAGLVSTISKKGAAAVLIVDSLLTQNPVGELSYNKTPAKQTVNYFTITPGVAAEIIGVQPDSLKFPLKTLKAEIGLEYDEVTTTLHATNVVGILEGKNRKDEYLIISAHHDHLGKKDTLIWYGADDDGSGTVSLLEIAEAFAKAKEAGKGPERNIVFLSVSGEEKGLWGSRYYSEHPIFPLNKTTADLNIDMVGRLDSAHIKTNDTSYIYIIGDDKLSSDLTPITEAANSITKLSLDRKYNDLKDTNRFYYRSDHYNFAEKGVPVIFYFNGTHPDYHRVTDTVDKINFDQMARRDQLVFYTAWEMANRPALLLRDKPLK